MTHVLQVGRQPGDVKVPAVAEAEVLQPEQPHGWRRQNPCPGNMRVPAGLAVDVLEQVELCRVYALVLAWGVAKPPEEEDRPDDSDHAEQLERPSPAQMQNK